MYKHVILTIFLITFFAVNSNAQQPVLLGKWKTPDRDIIEFYPEGNSLAAKQISTEMGADKKNNNRIVARELMQVNTRVYEGTVIDPKDAKTYHGRFTVSDSGTVLELKVKWGFLNFKETWKRVN